MIARDWLSPRDTRERRTMITWARRSRLVIVCAYFMMVTAYVCVVLLPRFGISLAYVIYANESERILPMQTYRIYDLSARPRYELAYIGQAAAFFSTAVMYTGVDSFLGLLVFHICGQLDILRLRFARLDRLAKFRDGLRSCVMNHTRLLRYMEIYAHVIAHRYLLLEVTLRQRAPVE